MDSYRFLWIPMDSYGFLWIPVDSYEFRWLPVGATFWHRSSGDSQVVLVLVGWFEELLKNLN
jgi:hypothetical protein